MKIRIAITRDKEQNSFYWAALVGPVAKHMGMRTENVHEAFKLIFNAGESTTTLVGPDFTRYCDDIIDWAKKTIPGFGVEEVE